jgi:hypothetical protein
MSNWVELTCAATGEPRLVNLGAVEQIEPEDPKARGARCLLRYTSGHAQAVKQSYAELAVHVDKHG